MKGLRNADADCEHGVLAISIVELRLGRQDNVTNVDAQRNVDIKSDV
jgi:hypothetical protein